MLDLSLPGVGGLDVLRRVRDGGALPVIVLSGRNGETDRIVGLDLGADDYLVKPFSPGELAARIRSVLRRTNATNAAAPVELDGLRIDPRARTVTVEGRRVELTAREFDLIAFLGANPDVVFTRRQILRRVWGTSSAWQGEATVTEHVRRVRLKIETDPASPSRLRTVRGVGYVLGP